MSAAVFAHLQGMSVVFDREHKEVAMKAIQCNSSDDNEPVWAIFIFVSVAFFSVTLCVVAIAVGVCEWRANRCRCRRHQNTHLQSGAQSPTPEFTKVEASFTPAIEGGYGAMDKIEQAAPISDSDNESPESA